VIFKPAAYTSIYGARLPIFFDLLIFFPFSENGPHPCAFILISFFEAYDYGDDTNHLATCPTCPGAQAR
jgi:hypothetical protein